MDTPKTFIFVGRSGSGKGTQLELLKKYIKDNFNDSPMYLFVMGDTLRSFAKNDGYAQEAIRSTINSGKLVPVFISGSMFVTSLLNNLHPNDNLFIDGIPRSVSQSQMIISIMDFYKRTNNFLIDIDVSEQEVEKRMLLRQRPDDTEDAIAGRLRFYEENVSPAILFLKENSNFKYFKINGERSIEEIHIDIVAKLKDLL